MSTESISYSYLKDLAEKKRLHYERFSFRQDPFCKVVRHLITMWACQGRKQTLLQDAPPSSDYIVPPPLAAALSVSTGPISNIVSPMSHSDTKTQEKRLQAEK